MFRKKDDEYVEMATDPIRRRNEIKTLSTRRILFLVIVALMAFGAIGGSCSGWNGRQSGLAFFGLIVSWSGLVQAETHLRLLKIVEKLQKGRDDKPTAQ